MTAAHLDIESRSTCDLKSAGLYRYWEDPETEVLVVRWRIGDGPVGEWVPLSDPSDEENRCHALVDHLRAGGTVTGHNIAFDREGWNRCISLPAGFPEIAVEQTDCTMARCASLSLPQSLEQAGKALGLKIQKDAEGHRLMMRMCKPKTQEPLTWHETPEQLARLSEYCAQDVLAECAIDAAVPQLSPSEKRLWVLDQKINARGVQLDMPMVDKALAVAERAALAASEQIYELTDGAVQRTTETAKIVKWLNARGIPAESIAKGEQDELLVRADLFDDPLARQVIELRRASAKSSVAKYRAMQRSVCKDGRVRGTLNFHGASTGRWAGRLIQPQNLPRIGDAGPDVEELHAILAAYDADEAFAVCQLNFDNPLDVLSKALRSMLIAKPGHELVGGDYSNIEGRVNAWLAGEDWKVQAFADFDAGVGADLYVLAYAKAFGVEPESVDKFLRQQGKVMELALGYQGGVRAFQKMAAGYGMVVSDERADELKVAWREAHPAIVKSWYALQDAAINAVRNPGMKVPCLDGKIIYMVKNNILWCRLPSGRPLAYVAPHIEQGKCKACGGTGGLFDKEADAFANPREDCPECWGRGEVKARVCFYGQNSATKKWQKNSLYGGLQCLTGDNLVLCRRGWVRLDQVEGGDQVWDGVDWVPHGGLVFKGVKQTLTLDGVRLTADHHVLTKQGWKSASSCEGLERPDVRLPDGFALPWGQREEVPLAFPLRVRGGSGQGGGRGQARKDQVLRVLPGPGAAGTRDHARHVEGAAVRGVAVDAGAVRQPKASGVGELRRAWDHCLRAVEFLRAVLGRYGAYLPAGVGHRSAGQRRWVQREQLPLGDAQDQQSQQAAEFSHRHSVGGDDCVGSSGAVRHRAIDALVSDRPGGPARFAVRETGRHEQVYDLLNCGPRHRFAVRSRKGLLLAHNCENVVQAIARDILAEGMFRLEDAGYPLVLTVHDENICEVPEGFGSPEELAELMSIVPTWAEGLPVAVSAWKDPRYVK